MCGALRLCVRGGVSWMAPAVTTPGVRPSGSGEGTTPRRVVVIGASGSVGRQAMDLIARYPEELDCVGAVVGTQDEYLRTIGARYPHARVGIAHPSGTVESHWLVGDEATCEIAGMDADVVLIAIPGAASLRPALAAAKSGADVALSSKEVLVLAGDIFRSRLTSRGGRLLPVDSEHSALWQCLRGEDPRDIARLVLTASGGALRDVDIPKMRNASPKEVLTHPVWHMGEKVTIDAATCLNKGFEVIEAHHLFDIPYDKISAVIHRQSIVHSYVEFVDGSIVAQMGRPSMALPIGLALTGGRRLPGVETPPDLTHDSPLTFEPLSLERYPLFGLALECGQGGGSLPVALNAADEVCVTTFMQGQCSFGELLDTIAGVVEATPQHPVASVEDIESVNMNARALARERLATHPARL